MQVNVTGSGTNKLFANNSNTSLKERRGRDGLIWVGQGGRRLKIKAVYFTVSTLLATVITQ